MNSNPFITLKSASRSMAQGQDIELRSTKTTRLIFRPQIVDNPHDSRASVRGFFVFQKKKPSGKWEDYKSLNLSQLKDRDWIKLELKSGELYKLITELNNYYEIFKRYGIVSGKTSFTVTPNNVKILIEQILESPDNFNRLRELKVDDLKKLNIISNINSLKSLLTTWQENKNNDNEDFWQTFFKNNSWVIAQVYAYPVVLFKDKAYVGGKSIENVEGNIIDFIFKNGFSDNVVLVEIKTPTTKLLGAKYRNTYCASSDLIGSVGQILNYKDSLQKDYYTLCKEGKKTFQAFNPKCMVILGSFEGEELDAKQKKCFELYRSDSKQVDIVTYDELFKKVSMLINLLE